MAMTAAISSSILFFFLHFLFQSCDANCHPSACGVFRNISYPFRLNGDPKHCGESGAELACENNVTSFYLNSHKYFVKEINYLSKSKNDKNEDSYKLPTIRVVDASINVNDTCSFPESSAYAAIFTGYYIQDFNRPINFLSCPTPLKLKNSSLFLDITHDCASISSQSPPRFTYIRVGSMEASDVPQTCGIELIVMTSWDFAGYFRLESIPLSEIHKSLLYGFELHFCTDCTSTYTKWDHFVYFFDPKLKLLSGAVVAPVISIIIGFTIVLVILLTIVNFHFHLRIRWGNSGFDPIGLYHGGYSLDPRSTGFISSIMIIGAPRFIICPLLVWLFIFLFRSGLDVAVKLLGKSGGNGQDFINEIATIGRIHHVNVVKLVGYCAHGSKRALVFDLMSNGSLEKYIYNEETINSLNLDKKFEIVVGVARGIEYLHRGCDVQILHFDIKPHNILLDDNFIPKISDFGLAKLHSTEKNTMTLTAARGTIGYVAPELINRGIGRVSYKADVYSFGMLLMDIVGLKRDLTGNNGDSSKYFPCWIYDHLNQEKGIKIGNLDDDDNEGEQKLARKMAIVSLWCIQMNPDDRPSINKVLEMLEDEVENLQIPNYSSQSPYIIANEAETWGTYSTDSVSLLDYNDAPSLEITIAE